MLIKEICCNLSNRLAELSIRSLIQTYLKLKKEKVTQKMGNLLKTINSIIL